MSTTYTDLPLHEVILQIMFLENKEKAAEIKPSEVLWKIDNPEITERQVREVLDWLVHHKRVELYLGKYCLNRIEFLKQKEIYEKGAPYKEEDSKTNTINIPSEGKTKTFYINSPKRKQSLFSKILFTLCILALCYLSYSLFELRGSLAQETVVQYTHELIVKIVSCNVIFIITLVLLYFRRN